MIKLFNKLFARNSEIKALETRIIVVEKKADTLTAHKIRFDGIESALCVVSDLYGDEETKILIKGNGEIEVKGSLIIKGNEEER